MARDDRFDDLGDDDLGDDDLGPDWDPTDLDYDDDGDWTEEDEARYQARRREELKRSRRTRRQAISFLVLVLLVLGAGVGAAGIAQGWWEWPFEDDGGSAARPTCGAPTPVAALPADTTVVVLNATDVRGLATAVAAVLTERGFKVSQVGNEDDAIEVPDSVHIRHGPESLLEAKAVAAHFVSPVLVDDGRTGHVVELSIGLGYRRMVDAETAAAAVAPVPGPSVAGCIPPSTPATTTTDPAQTTPAPTP